MILTSTIVVARKLDDVWLFFADVGNAPKWDRSIARATLASKGMLGTGSIVETTSPGGKRQSFRVIAFEPPRLLSFRLLQSPLFRSADLTFRLEATDGGGGTKITHEIHLRLRLWSLFLWPVLTLTSRRALSTDFEYLRRSLEEGLDLTSHATRKS